MPTAVDLRAAYQQLADKAAEFDRQTTLMLRQREQEQKEWLAARKAEKAELMKEKLDSSIAMNDAETEEAEAAKAAKAAEEAKPPPAPEPTPKEKAKPAHPPRVAEAFGQRHPKTGPVPAKSERAFEDKDAK